MSSWLQIDVLFSIRDELASISSYSYDLTLLDFVYRFNHNIMDEPQNPKQQKRQQYQFVKDKTFAQKRYIYTNGKLRIQRNKRLEDSRSDVQKFVYTNGKLKIQGNERLEDSRSEVSGSEIYKQQNMLVQNNYKQDDVMQQLDPSLQKYRQRGIQMIVADTMAMQQVQKQIRNVMHEHLQNLNGYGQQMLYNISDQDGYQLLLFLKKASFLYQGLISQNCVIQTYAFQKNDADEQQTQQKIDISSNKINICNQMMRALNQIITTCLSSQTLSGQEMISKVQGLKKSFLGLSANLEMIDENRVIPLIRDTIARIPSNVIVGMLNQQLVKNAVNDRSIAIEISLEQKKVKQQTVSILKPKVYPKNQKQQYISQNDHEFAKQMSKLSSISDTMPLQKIRILGQKTNALKQSVLQLLKKFPDDASYFIAFMAESNQTFLMFNEAFSSYAIIVESLTQKYLFSRIRTKGWNAKVTVIRTGLQLVVSDLLCVFTLLVSIALKCKFILSKMSSDQQIVKIEALIRLFVLSATNIFQSGVRKGSAVNARTYQIFKKVKLLGSIGISEHAQYYNLIKYLQRVQPQICEKLDFQHIAQHSSDPIEATMMLMNHIKLSHEKTIEFIQQQSVKELQNHSQIKERIQEAHKIAQIVTQKGDQDALRAIQQQISLCKHSDQNLQFAKSVITEKQSGNINGLVRLVKNKFNKQARTLNTTQKDVIYIKKLLQKMVKLNNSHIIRKLAYIQSQNQKFFVQASKAFNISAKQMISMQKAQAQDIIFEIKKDINRIGALSQKLDRNKDGINQILTIQKNISQNFQQISQSVTQLSQSVQKQMSDLNQKSDQTLRAVQSIQKQIQMMNKSLKGMQSISTDLSELRIMTRKLALKQQQQNLFNEVQNGNKVTHEMLLQIKQNIQSKSTKYLTQTIEMISQNLMNNHQQMLQNFQDTRQMIMSGNQNVVTLLSQQNFRNFEQLKGQIQNLGSQMTIQNRQLYNQQQQIGQQLSNQNMTIYNQQQTMGNQIMANNNQNAFGVVNNQNQNTQQILKNQDGATLFLADQSFRIGSSLNDKMIQNQNMTNNALRQMMLLELNQMQNIKKHVSSVGSSSLQQNRQNFANIYAKAASVQNLINSTKNMSAQNFQQVFNQFRKQNQTAVQFTDRLKNMALQSGQIKRQVLKGIQNDKQLMQKTILIQTNLEIAKQVLLKQGKANLSEYIKQADRLQNKTQQQLKKQMQKNAQNNANMIKQARQRIQSAVQRCQTSLSKDITVLRSQISDKIKSIKQSQDARFSEMQKSFQQARQFAKQVDQRAEKRAMMLKNQIKNSQLNLKQFLTLKNQNMGLVIERQSIKNKNQIQKSKMIQQKNHQLQTKQLNQMQKAIDQTNQLRNQLTATQKQMESMKIELIRIQTESNSQKQLVKRFQTSLREKQNQILLLNQKIQNLNAQAQKTMFQSIKISNMESRMQNKNHGLQQKYNIAKEQKDRYKAELKELREQMRSDEKYYKTKVEQAEQLKKKEKKIREELQEQLEKAKKKQKNLQQQGKDMDKQLQRTKKKVESLDQIIKQNERLIEKIRDVKINGTRYIQISGNSVRTDNIQSLADNYEKIQKQYENTKQNSVKYKKQAEQKQKSIIDQTKILDAEKRKNKQLAQKFQKLSKQKEDLQNEWKKNDKELKKAKDTSELFESNLKSVKEQLGKMDISNKQKQSQLEKIKNVEKNVLKQVGDLKKQVKTLQQAKKTIQTKLQVKQKEIVKMNGQNAEKAKVSSQQVNNLKQQITKLKQKADKITKQKQQLQQKVKKGQDTNGTMKQKIDSLDKAIQKNVLTIKQKQSEITAKNNSISKSLAQLKVKQQQIKQAKEKFAQTQKELKSIIQVQEKKKQKLQKQMSKIRRELIPENQDISEIEAQKIIQSFQNKNTKLQQAQIMLDLVRKQLNIEGNLNARTLQGKIAEIQQEKDFLNFQLKTIEQQQLKKAQQLDKLRKQNRQQQQQYGQRQQEKVLLDFIQDKPMKKPQITKIEQNERKVLQQQQRIKELQRKQAQLENLVQQQKTRIDFGEMSIIEKQNMFDMSMIQFDETKQQFSTLNENYLQAKQNYEKNKIHLEKATNQSMMLKKQNQSLLQEKQAIKNNSFIIQTNYTREVKQMKEKQAQMERIAEISRQKLLKSEQQLNKAKKQKQDAQNLIQQQRKQAQFDAQVAKGKAQAQRRKLQAEKQQVQKQLARIKKQNQALIKRQNELNLQIKVNLQQMLVEADLNGFSKQVYFKNCEDYAKAILADQNEINKQNFIIELFFQKTLQTLHIQGMKRQVERKTDEINGVSQFSFELASKTFQNNILKQRYIDQNQRHLKKLKCAITQRYVFKTAFIQVFAKAIQTLQKFADKFTKEADSSTSKGRKDAFAGCAQFAQLTVKLFRALEQCMIGADYGIKACGINQIKEVLQQGDQIRTKLTQMHKKQTNDEKQNLKKEIQNLLKIRNFIDKNQKNFIMGEYQFQNAFLPKELSQKMKQLSKVHDEQLNNTFTGAEEWGQIIKNNKQAFQKVKKPKVIYFNDKGVLENQDLNTSTLSEKLVSNKFEDSLMLNRTFDPFDKAQQLIKWKTRVNLFEMKKESNQYFLKALKDL